MSSRPTEPPEGDSGFVVQHGHHSEEGASELRPGWNRAQPEHVPGPTYWPIVMALGITVIGWGIITTYILSAIGMILFAIALAGWIGELRHGD